MTYKALIFDLDDTLMDTHSQLITKAYGEACSQMIEEGLKASFDDCMQKRKELFLQNPREEIFPRLVEEFNSGDAKVEKIVKKGNDAFYKRDISENLKLFSGVRQMLEDLKKKYSLFLVTAGNLSTQKQKVKVLNIEPFFNEVLYVDPEKGECKKQAFLNILKKHDLSPSKCLSIGNRLDKEIIEANELGMKTCYLEHGEHTYLTPEHKNEFPDFQIQNICDLIAICHL